MDNDLYAEKSKLLSTRFKHFVLINQRLRYRLCQIKKEILQLRRLKRHLFKRLLRYGDRFMDSCLEIPDTDPTSNVLEDGIFASVCETADKKLLDDCHENVDVKFNSHYVVDNLLSSGCSISQTAHYQPPTTTNTTIIKRRRPPASRRKSQNTYAQKISTCSEASYAPLSSSLSDALTSAVIEQTVSDVARLCHADHTLKSTFNNTNNGLLNQ